MEIEKISIWRLESEERRRCWRLSPKQLAPQGLQVTARYPPCRRIVFLYCHIADLTELLRGHELEVQIFGIKKSADTRKALRFFAERRIRTHFVDLNERAASVGELRRFVQKFGAGALVDTTSKRYAELGLRYAQISDEKWLAKLADEPLMLRMPLVRFGNQLVIGADEAAWKNWIANS